MEFKNLTLQQKAGIIGQMGVYFLLGLLGVFLIAFVISILRVYI